MKRATITFSDALEQKLSAYMAQQRTPPSLNTVVQVALDEFLENQQWVGRDLRPATGPLNITVSEEGSRERDISVDHDKYFADSVYARKLARHTALKQEAQVGDKSE